MRTAIMLFTRDLRLHDNPALAAACAAAERVVPLFVFDPASRRVVQTVKLPGAQVNTSIGGLSGSKLVGLTARSVYVFDIERGDLAHSAAAPVHVGCGFALVDGAVYFGSGPSLWRYRLPE